MSKTQELATWFVREILKTPFDYRFHRRHLRDAKNLINPTGDETPIDEEAVRLCILEMSRGGLGWDSSKPITSMYAVTWGDPPYMMRFFNKLREIPPVYEVRTYDSWVKTYGPLAKRLGIWEGTYRGYCNPLESEFRIPRAEIERLGLVPA